MAAETTHFYTEPQKEAKKEKGQKGQHWFVEQIERSNRRVAQHVAFHSEQAALDYLNKKSFYVDGKLVHEC